MKKIVLLLLTVPFIFSGCEKEKEEHYKRPDWLEGPLFEQIKSTGEFNEFVKAAEYAGYDEFLSSRLNFTVFVPTDAAFQSYYQEKGIQSIENMDEQDVLALLQFHSLQNSWDSVKMEGKTSFGWWSNSADNFRTPCIYTPPVTQVGDKYVAYDNTFLHLYSTPFFNKNNYSAIDYESFYPNSAWTGYNVDGASILENEQGAENGFYYVIDKVLEPRTTADQVIGEKSEFSLFKKLIDRFIRYDKSVEKSENSSLYDLLYTRHYALNFDLSNEKIPDNAYDGYYHVFNSVFIPDEQAIRDYFSENFPSYPTIEDVPNIVVKYFVEAHMVPNKKLFPSTLANSENETNDFSDEILFDLGNGINSRHMASNALIYGVGDVINTNAFSTVSGPVIRDPDYKIFTIMLELSGEIRSFFKKEISHAIFVLPDDIMINLGFAYEENDPIDFTDDQIYRDNSELTVEQISDFLQNYICITSKSVNGVDETFVKSKNNKYLKVSDNGVEGLFGQASVTNIYDANNGTVLEIDTDLSQGESYTIEDYLNDNKDSFTEFFALCDSAGMLNDEGDISKLSLFTGITLLLPTDAAIQNIKETYIPAEATAETFNYRGLIQYQVISERIVFTDDEFPQNEYGTDLFINAERYKINVGASGGVIDITDLLNNSYQITSGTSSNIITSTGIIHIVNQVAQY